MTAINRPTVVDIRDVALPGQPLPPDVVYIGRAWHIGGWSLPQSAWANPYSVKRWGRDEALRRYRSSVWRALDGLSGKRLACWCKREGQRCHGDVLIEIGADMGLWPAEEGDET